MTRKLKPVLGLAVAALIGTAYATCYVGVTGVCVSAGEWLETLPLECGDRDVTAKNDWGALDMIDFQYHPGSGRTGIKPKDCCGTATYTDCTGHPQDIQNYCSRNSYWAPDPAQPSCTT